PMMHCRAAVSIPHRAERSCSMAGDVEGFVAETTHGTVRHISRKDPNMMENPDAIVVGAGLAGLVATYELQRAGRRVLVLDQEGRQNLGGQAFWSLGGLFFVDSPEQRRMGIHDSVDLAMQDWFGSAQFDRDEDYW